MAGTMGCAECHDHKYDPYRTKDFYSFAAFFADVEEIAVGRQRQTPLPLKDQAEQMQKLNAQVAVAKAAYDKQAVEADKTQPKWEETLTLPQLRALPPEIRSILLSEPKARSDQARTELAKYYRGVAPQLEAARKQLAESEKRKKDFEQTLPTSLVAMSVAPRTMRVLPRGNWLDDSGEVVQPAVPAF